MCHAAGLTHFVLTLHTIAPQYAVNRESLGVDWSDPAIQKDIVADFDSAVNSWVDAVPRHLRWDPHQPDRVSFEQSCLLYALVYTVQVGWPEGSAVIAFAIGPPYKSGCTLSSPFGRIQILIHRPFLPKPGRPVSQLGVASLAICTSTPRVPRRTLPTHISNAG